MIKNENQKLLEELMQGSLTFQILYTANLHNSFRRNFHKKFISPDISPDITTILFFMTINPDITQTELAKYLFKGKAHVGKILNEMERIGLIRRETKEHSIKNIILPKGKQLNKKAFVQFQKIKEIMDKALSEKETKQFLDYLSIYRKTLASIVDVKLK